MKCCNATLLWPKELKFRILDDSFLFTFSKKIIFAATRMRIIFVAGWDLLFAGEHLSKAKGN